VLAKQKDKNKRDIQRSIISTKRHTIKRKDTQRDKRKKL
jgi:hypothetical protein